MKSRRQKREAIVAKKRAAGKLRKSHRFNERFKEGPMDDEQMEAKFMTGETP